MELTDVLVIGSGIAGLCAAIEAARTGATVTVASAGKTMSGSSFFPGTWGLGLIGPVNEDDEQDLIDTILAVGGGVADPELVQAFVHGIPQAIDWLEQDLGVELQRPQSAKSAQQKQFIPCFDHKTRMWRGLTRKPLEDALTTWIESLGIRLLPRHELIDLVEDTNGRITGTVLYDLTENRIVPFAAKATVIAAGGTGGLFERSLTSADVLSSSQAIALAHGATLTNIEFMQMMPGFIEPRRNLVFNEKTWRYVHVDQPVDIADDKLDDLLEQRSGYGPFTSRLASRAIDLVIDQAGVEGLALHYDFPREDVPEFVQTFATWLQDEHGIAPTDEMRVAMYAHAANGGIKIDKTAHTGVEGLYARTFTEILCTECGADGMIGTVDKCERALFTSAPKHGKCIGTRSGKCRFPAVHCGIAAAESRKPHDKTAYFDILPSPRIGTPVKRVGKAHHSRLITIVYARRLRH